jgi:hypothetical protein
MNMKVITLVTVCCIAGCGSMEMSMTDAGAEHAVVDANAPSMGPVVDSATPTVIDNCEEISTLENFDRSGQFTSRTRTYGHGVAGGDVLRNWWMCKNNGFYDYYQSYCTGPNDAGVPYCNYTRNTEGVQCQVAFPFKAVNGKYYIPCGSTSEYDSDDDGTIETYTDNLADYVTDSP